LKAIGDAYKNKTVTDNGDKATDTSRKWHSAIVQKYDVGVGDVSTRNCKSEKWKKQISCDVADLELREHTNNDEHDVFQCNDGVYCYGGTTKKLLNEIHII
jgi:hypothetical protein